MVDPFVGNRRQRETGRVKVAAADRAADAGQPTFSLQRRSVTRNAFSRPAIAAAAFDSSFRQPLPNPSQSQAYRGAGASICQSLCFRGNARHAAGALQNATTDAAAAAVGFAAVAALR